MRRLARLPLALGAFSLLLACHGDRAVTPPMSGPTALISDGAHGGEAHFYFHPPLVPDPTGLITGDFNPNLAPVVEVCRLEANPLDVPAAECIGDAVLPATRAQLVATDEMYHFNWDTKASYLDPTAFYRILVFSSPTRSDTLGFIDVDPVDGGMKNAKSGDTYQFQDGRTLPIKFRIEGGALCTDDTDCVEAVARGGQDNTITTPSERAGVFIPADALNEGEEITVIIQLHAGRPCLPADLPQQDECYDYFSDPPVRDRVPTPGSDAGVTQEEEGGFNVPVTVAMCVDVGDLTSEQIDSLQLHKFDPDADNPRVEALPNAFASFITCAEFPEEAGVIPALLRHLAALLSPRPLFAANQGLGGETGSFSTIGWGLPSQMTVEVAPPAEAVTGTDVTPVVHIADLTSLRNPLAGVSVQFSTPDGNAIGAPIPTDQKGNAAVSWTLANATGGQTLLATARAVAGSPITFTVRAIELSGGLTDPAGDVVPSPDRLHPDLVSATVGVADGLVTLSVRFAEGSFDADVSAVTFSLDTDQNPATGHPGLDEAGTIDDELIGSEFIVRMGSSCEAGEATLKEFTGTLNEFREVARATVSVVTNGYDVSFPFAHLADDGRLNFKVTASALISGCGFTGILDIMSNQGSAVGSTTEVPDEPIG